LFFKENATIFLTNLFMLAGITDWFH